MVYHAPNVKTRSAALLVYKQYKAQTRGEVGFGALAAMPDLVENSRWRTAHIDRGVAMRDRRGRRSANRFRDAQDP
ncbi:MAG: hypothetical protein WBM01_18610 [Mycobacterium sp.]|uniref:hypothetical protein n=1 Tax=Mycobacterium sp. TaxID=1785 RepID=UPI003C71E0C7